MTRAELQNLRLNLPPVNLRLRADREGQLHVFDPLRKKWVVLTSEEFVRQNFTPWLTAEYGFPPSLMANEQGIRVNDTLKRCDTILFRPDSRPLVIVEYKAPAVTITQGVFDQIVRYNMELHADYLIVSNGMQHYCCKIDYNNGTYHFIPRIPQYEDIV